ncbi:restriction endonuclease subunit S [Enorma phocaeensis]|uniref:restriction endonuclease subunit S n=2 Tax=Bacteria TaxID=2 RepID=UPI00097D1F3A|nr:restriction endonuclease subunit S [Enorma phocaeensis]
MRLGELISKAKAERCGDRSFPVLSMTMHDGIIAQSERFKKAIASKDVSSYKVVYPGQLVVGFPIDEGVINVQGFDEPGIMSPAYNIWNIDASIIFPDYLDLALHGPGCMAYYADKMRGTTARRRTLTSDSLTAMSVPLPDINQQKHIVGIFDAVRVQMNACRHQLSLLDDLVKSRFVEMFGDPAASPKFETCRVEDIADVFVGVVVKPKQYYADDSKNAVKAFRSLNVGEMHIRDNDWVYFTQEGNQAASKSILKSGDILIVRSGYPGTSCIVSSEYEGCNAIDLIIARIKDDGVLPEFLAAFNNSTRMKDLIERMSVGSAQKHFNVGFYKQVEIPLPPIEIQREYLAFQHRVDKSRFVVQQQVVKYNDVIASSGIAIIGRDELV